ncbi:Cell division cycle 7-related protein kinase, partial [Pseudolycoriella hygida]
IQFLQSKRFRFREVMSNTEKCGLSNSEKPDDEIINSNHRNIRVSTRDEKLIAELKTHIPDVENIFDVHRRIGEGTFSTVFLATLKCHSEMPQSKRKLFAVKFIVPTSHPNRIERELKCLLDVGGSENIVGVNLCLRQNNSVAFVMPYIAYDKFHTYVHKMNARDLQDYMRNLLIALKRVHSFGIIHRDVKPSNFLHDRKNKKYLLVDFGLAQFVSSREDSTNVLGETSTTRKRKASEINETGKSCALNTAKRARTQYSQERPPQQEQLPPPPPQQSSAAVIDENDPRLRSNLASIPLLQFKLPLKENNKLPGLKDETQPDNLNSPLTQQIKSTVLSYSLREKLTKKKMTENSPTYTT